ncbi:solute carrier family 43 member 3 [Biomphalaria glabrata]|nr:solute carrier family 43 member 3 [Biomphalaria glabrata]
MMTFTSGSFPWLIVPALALTGVAGSAVLLTNLQTANLFGRKRHVVVSLYVGAAYSNGVITWMMKLSHFSGVNVQTSFMFLTIGIVPMLVSTVAFLPKTHIPWPLPADYGKRRNQSLDENLIRKQRAWQRRMSEDLDPDIDPQMFPDSSQLTDYDSTEAGMVRCRRPPPSFTPSAVQPLFVWSLLWYGIHRLHEAIYETGVVEMADLEIMGPLDYETYFGVIQLLGIVISPIVGVLIDRHYPRELGTSPATQQMQRIIPAILVTSALAVTEIAVDMIPGAAPKAISTLINILHKVFTHTTMCAFVMHVHFNHQHLGKFYGLTCAVSALFSAFQFPIWKFLLQKYKTMLPVHILLLLLSIVTFVHGVNVWQYCKKRLIRDHSDQSSERGCRAAPNHQPPSFHIETDSSNLPPTKDPVKIIFTDDSGVKQQITYPNTGSMEMSEVTSRLDMKNGGVHIILETPDDEGCRRKGSHVNNDAEAEEEEEEEEEDDEEEVEMNVMDFISL